MAKPSQSEVFEFCGPLHLTNVDWSVPEYRKSVAASLIQGVYVAEEDRQREKRGGGEKLGPIWWNYFHFESVQSLVDKADSSIFGMIFENKLENDDPANNAPKYVIAFRGTLLKCGSWKQDIKLDLKLFLNKLSRDSRYHIAKKAVEGIIEGKDLEKSPVWLVGHSLGAALALQTGKDMAKNGCYIETKLFNPPYVSALQALLKIVHNPDLKKITRITRSIAVYGVSRLKTKITKKDDALEKREAFTSLHCWFPQLFVNPKDPICQEYISYFEHREDMKLVAGLARIESIVTKTSLNSLILDKSNGDNLRSIPSAIITKNTKIVEESHALSQWWESHSSWESQVYQFYKNGGQSLRIQNK